MADKEDTTIESNVKVGALYKSSAWLYNREAVTTNADHVKHGDWHTVRRTTAIVDVAKTAPASSSTQPTRRESVINAPAGIHDVYAVSVNVESDDDMDGDVEFISAPSSPPRTTHQQEWCP